MLMDGFEFKRYRASVLAADRLHDLKNLNAEQARPETAEGERPQSEDYYAAVERNDALTHLLGGGIGGMMGDAGQRRSPAGAACRGGEPGRGKH